MKAFTEENFKLFIASEPDYDKDDHFATSQERAHHVLEKFNAWRAEPPKPSIAYPVRRRANNAYIVEDAKGKKVATTVSPTMALHMVAVMNAEYNAQKETDEDERPPKAAVRKTPPKRKVRPLARDCDEDEEDEE